MADRKRILVVDDDREIVRGLCLRLRTAGHEVDVAHNGVDGLAAIQAARPDLIVLDLRMPAMDGMELLAQLRGQDPSSQIPVIVLSASVLDTARKEAIALGVRYFLQKPYDAAKLMQTVDAAIGAPAGAVGIEQQGLRV